MTRLIACLTFLLCISFSSPGVFAHKASDSYLSLTLGEQNIQGQWDIALRDLDYAIGVDGNQDGAITWGELRTRHAAITAYAFSRFEANAGGRACLNQVTEHLVDRHTDGAYAVMRFTVDCPGAGDLLELRYDLLFDLDPLHRGLLRLEKGGEIRTAIFSPDRRAFQPDFSKPSVLGEFLQFGREGVWHIWIGYDHILFLLSLLLPAVLRWDAGRWHPAEGFRAAFWGVFKIVTAFTIAHTITLSLAVLGFVSLPSRLVESGIAASVLVAALNNLYPVVRARLWVIAFAFGLVHGLGFASVLMDLGLVSRSLAVALTAFNLGVEVGQIAIVSAFLPVAYLLRYSWFYQRFVVGGGSVAIVILASVWLLERSLGIQVASITW